ncbi:MAG: hypothetical protein IKD58_11195 [Loktanella sp.]|nr:hypothetical protein [Loktanella sp.]
MPSGIVTEPFDDAVCHQGLSPDLILGRALQQDRLCNPLDRNCRPAGCFLISKCRDMKRKRPSDIEYSANCIE